MDAYTITEEHKQAILPYLGLVSQKIDTIQQDTVQAMFMDASQKSEDFQKAMNDNFAAADADKDGKLNADEFVAFEKKRYEYHVGKFGEGIQFTDDEYKEHYQLMNEITPGVDGVSFQDLLIANDVYVMTAAESMQ